MIRMTAGSGMKDIQALIPIVGSGKAASAEEITTIICLEGRTCSYGRYETRYAQRERESEAQRGITLLATVTMNNQQKPQKVTKSLYIVTHLGQLPFMLFT